MEQTAAVRPMAISFGPFALYACRRQLFKNGQLIQLGSRAFEILFFLVSHAGQIVEKSRLISAVWPETIVEECNLRVHISALRKVLESDSDGFRYIENVSGRGYRFLGHIEQVPLALPQSVSDSSFILPEFKSRLTKLTQLIGRDHELEEMGYLLSESRCVTIAGPGGIGKTSLAAKVAEEQSRHYTGGCYFIDFSQYSEKDPVLYILTKAFNLTSVAAEPWADILLFLRGMPVLLILDNCERFVATLGGVIEYLIQHAPETDVLVTSREQLRIAWEYVYYLKPLIVPPLDMALQAKDLPYYSASHLLLQRVRAIQPELPITNCQVPYITRICSKLDGLPLALELAALRVPLVGFRELELRLANRFSFLTKGRRTAPQRHQNLHDMVKWSYDTLTAREAKIWQQLGQFTGQFNLTAIQTLLKDDVGPEYELDDIMDNLVSKSMVCTHWIKGEIHFSLLETMRYFALERLNELNE